MAALMGTLLVAFEHGSAKSPILAARYARGVTLRLALVGGPMYDGLYRLLDDSGVEIVVQADHPTLNRRAAELLACGERIDLLATHSKYAPSQAAWLRPLDGVVASEWLAPLAPKAVELCRFRGVLLCVPRNIDVRVLWANRRLLGTRPVPESWAKLAASGLAFGFPGRESGLFGTFFEIVTAFGGRLFDDALRPTLESDAARQAVELLVRLAKNAPPDLCDWHYDQVDEALGAGRVALAAAWPGGTRALLAAPAGDDLEPHPYLSGRSYAGCHAWAIPNTCGDLDGALRLLERLGSAEAHALEAESGAVCARTDVFGAIRGGDARDARRLQITRDTVAHRMITYPPLARFPEVEDAGWGALQRALRGEIDARAALAEMQAAAVSVLGERH
jgi:multiple sugar transport system substrate-binding protein